MRLFGLIGYPLAHSFSGQYFEKKFRHEGIHDAEYRLFELRNLDDLDQLITEEQELCGLNVTIPYKQRVIPMLDSLDPVAEIIGAVNCIRIERTGAGFRTIGFNTDASGFERSVSPLIKGSPLRALVLGTGGSARAVAYALERMGIPHRFVSRKPRENNVLSYGALDDSLMQVHRLIVNATPVGMHPHVDGTPEIPYHLLNTSHLLFDLVYNPSETRFMALGKKAGARVKNGLDMLYLQADYAWSIWNNDAAGQDSNSKD